MLPGADPMGAPSSFTARRPNASNLPNFELPPPPLSHLQHKYQSFSNTQPSPVPGSIASVGNLLTPPSGVPGDGMSPVSSAVTSGSSASTQGVPPYTPTGYTWPPPPPSQAPYGFQSGSAPQYVPARGGLFSPSTLNGITRNNTTSPTTGEGLPPPPYDLSLPPFPSSMTMSAPPVPSAASHQQISNALMGGQTPVSTASAQHSPVHTQEGFHGQRPPPTPAHYNGSQPSSTSHQQHFPYSSGPSPTLQSPLSAGGPMSRASPQNPQGPVPSLPSAPQQSPQPYQRPFGGYPLPGPVLSNMNNPNGPLALVGGMPIGMNAAFNSGHAASMPHVYGAHSQQPAPPNDRPFKCDQCPQSFNRNHDLKRHKRIHLAVKPFPCGHCDKSFSRKDALKRHILVKGCGKAQAAAEAEKQDESVSPGAKSEGISDGAETSPVVHRPNS
ncbi:MAG: hypothetical protein M1821_008294 [Bathelium mastoideum]|nr:MAG: hypothetical protein M1821_008294 [Bathelium mastoideum]